MSPITSTLISTIVVTLCAYAGSFSSGVYSSSPCAYTDDRMYGGISVDCQGRRLNDFPPAQWLPNETTSLHLGNNFISHLDVNSLEKVTELRYLCLASNNFKSIEQNSFLHSANLQVIDLSGNKIRLDGSTNSSAWFHGLHSLLSLNLASNGNQHLYSDSSLYSPHLLSGLKNLRSLSLDTFTGVLDCNGIFNQTANLKTLLLTGGMTAIKNGTFKDFDSIRLKKLEIVDAPNLKTTEPASLQYLNSLDTYSLSNLQQGMTTTLGSLRPFIRRNFTMLRFNSIKGDIHQPDTFTRDGILTNYIARHLSEICVKHFVFRDNGLFYIESNVFANAIWTRCLQSLDLSDNPVLGQKETFLRLATLRALQSLTFINRKYCLFNKGGGIQSYNLHRYTAKITQSRDKTEGKNVTKHDQLHNASTSSNQISFESVLDLDTDANIGEKYVTMPVLHDHQPDPKTVTKVVLFIPKHIAYVNLAGYHVHSLKFETPLEIRGADNLKEFHVSDSGLYKMIQPMYGLHALTTIDLSKNDGSQLTPAFISSFPNATTLNMSQMGLSSIFSPPGRNSDLYNALPNLRVLDLSDNDLYVLPESIFSKNRNLQILNLSGNRFKTIMFGVQYLPNLHILDLQWNSFLQLSSRTTSVLEKYALSNPSFSLKLTGNVFSCSCSSIKFISWLHTTTVHIDTTMRFSCITENGQITSYNVSDAKNLRRKCNGKMAFMTSLIFLCLMALGFSVIAFYMKFKTQLLAIIFQYVKKEFSLKTPKDYSTGVYMSYSDNDINFACVTLRTFIENRLRLTTYVRHRDLLPASDIAASTVTAINSSWRILLVITESYLSDKWSFLAMKTAAYAVSSSNPGRLVVIVMSDRARYQIPDYLLNAIKEDNIVLVTLQGDQCLSKEEEGDLRRALLS